MTNKKVLVAIPQRLLEQTDLLASCRCQTRSELIREALRLHIENSGTSRAAVSLVAPIRMEDRAVAQ